MSGHTPGPWTISPVRTVDGEYMVVGGPGKEFGLIAAVTEEADARLIAAAPEMLAALSGVVRILQAVRLSAGLHGSQITRMEAAIAAIAKATEPSAEPPVEKGGVGP